MNRESSEKNSFNVASSVTYHGELMHNHALRQPLTPPKKMESLLDSDGDLFHFTLEEDQNSIFLTTPKQGDRTAWRRINLLGSASVPGTIVDFHAEIVSLGPNEGIQVVMAVASGGSYQLFTTGPLTPGAFLEHTPWTNCTYNLGGSTINQILISFSGDIIVATKEGQEANAKFHLLQDQERTWTDYNVPLDVNTIQDVVAGSYKEHPGLMCLFNQKGIQTVMFVGYPMEHGLQHRYEYPTDGLSDINSIATHPDPAESGTYYLYLSHSKGITRYKSILTGDMLEIHSLKEGEKPITDIQVSRKEQKISLFGIQDDGEQNTNVIYLSNNYYWVDTNFQEHEETGKWNSPIVLKRRATRFSCVRGNRGTINQVVTFPQDSGPLAHLYQDGGTTLWKEGDIPINTPASIVKMTTYSTHVEFVTDQIYQNPPMDRTVTLTASSTANVIVNGAHYQVGPNQPAAVELDVQGHLTIIDSVTSLHSPRFFVSGNSVPGSKATIDPTEKLMERFGALNTDTFQNATRLNGQPLWNSQNKPNGATAAAFIQCKEGVMKALQTVNQKGNFRELDGTTWGVEFGKDGSWRYFDGEEAKRFFTENPDASTRDFFGAIGHFFGDVVKDIENAISSIGQLVWRIVGDVVHLIVDGVKFVLKTAEEVIGALKWLFHKLELIVEDILEWLGALFDWDEIVKVHNVMSKLFTQTLDYGKSEIATVETKVNQFLDKLNESFGKIDQLKPDVTGTGIKQYGNNNSSNPKVHKATSGPQANYHSYHMKHSGVMQAKTTGLSYGNGPPTGLFEFLANDLEKSLGPVPGQFNTAMQRIVKDLDNGLTAQGMIDALKALMSLLISIVKDVADGILQFLGDLIDSIKTLVTGQIDIPFLSLLYKLISGHSLTPLDGVCLLLAIPMTVSYKVITGDSLYSRMESLDKFASGTDLYTALMEGLPTRSEAPLTQVQTDYIHVGIVTSILLPLADEIATLIDTKTEGFTNWISIVQIILGLADTATSFPVAINRGDVEWTELAAWIMNAANNTFGSIGALVWGWVASESQETLVKGLSTAADAGVAVITLILMLASSVEDYARDEGGSSPHNLVKTMKLFQNLLWTAGSGCSVAVDITEDEDPWPEVFALAALLCTGTGGGLMLGRFLLDPGYFEEYV